MKRTEGSYEEGSYEEGSFEAERPRLVGMASRILGDAAEAEDVVQQAWLRLHGAQTSRTNTGAGEDRVIENLPPG